MVLGYKHISGWSRVSPRRHSCWWGSSSNTDTDSDAESDGHTDAESNSDADADADSDTNSDADSSTWWCRFALGEQHSPIAKCRSIG